jgi:hypothetical protein
MTNPIRLFIAFCLFLASHHALNAKSAGKILFKDDFRNAAHISSDYIIEGGKISIADGQLRLQANPGSGDTYPNEAGIWIRKPFEGDISIEFEMTSLSANRSATDLQLFMFYGTAQGLPIESLFIPGKGLPMPVLKAQKGLIAINFANTVGRDGKVLTGTIVNSPACLLIYNCPGGTVLSKTFASGFKVGKSYRIKAEYRNHQLLYYIDGTLVAQGDDPDGGKRRGAVGFRTYMNNVTIRNLVIRRN